MIDELRVADADRAAALSGTFGWPHRPEDWALFLRLGRGIAWRETGRLCGTAMWFPLGPAHASIGLVQVDPAVQGRGIGKWLMRLVMEAALPRHLMLHATLAGAALYEALGFKVIGTVQQWQGICGYSPDGHEAATLARCEDILKLDEVMTGLARGELLNRCLADATIKRAGDQGYGALRRFGRGNLIGPVIAKDGPTAIQLIRGLAEPGFIRIDIPSEKRAITDGLGLVCVDEVQVMITGDWPSADCKFSLAAQALG